ncbi:hypothetical protein HPB51_016359 [Rhipicephalus microplus]|uniref:Peptidase A2 domain-containing protein n=1 Tax=Rhipicephalus microplus TaxID=6941 RepID=A0A9J6EPD9_RHIMP|nr:hypothetical protein HPB51_016359 [Rhipicephalus microplus]
MQLEATLIGTPRHVFIAAPICHVNSVTWQMGAVINNVKSRGWNMTSVAKLDAETHETGIPRARGNISNNHSVECTVHVDYILTTAAGPAFSMVVLDTTGKVRVTASAWLPSAEAAEEMTITSAVLHSGADVTLITSDSKSAIPSYMKGWASEEVARMLSARAGDFASGKITDKALK